MADLFVAQSLTSPIVNPTAKSVRFVADGYYFHLRRYFESANLERGRDLVALYDDSQLDGYQLDRLDDELTSAYRDALAKPDQWQVLVGWSDPPARNNEIWKTVDRKKLVEIIERMQWLISYARERQLKLIVSGD